MGRGRSLGSQVAPRRAQNLRRWRRCTAPQGAGIRLIATPARPTAHQTLNQRATSITQRFADICRARASDLHDKAHLVHGLLELVAHRVHIIRYRIERIVSGVRSIGIADFVQVRRIHPTQGWLALSIDNAGLGRVLALLRSENHYQVRNTRLWVDDNVDSVDVRLTLIASFDILQMEALAELQELERGIDADLIRVTSVHTSSHGRRKPLDVKLDFCSGGHCRPPVVL